MSRHRVTGIARRALLLGAGAFALLPRIARARSGIGGTERAALSILRHPASAARIGRRVLACYPDIADGSVLAAIAATGDGGAFRSLVAQRIRQDFAIGDVVAIDGWILSRTEARLYAVVALARDGGQSA